IQANTNLARRLLPLSLGLFQGALLLFFALFATYDEPSAAATQDEDGTRAVEQLPNLFPLFQDIQVMLAVGLGLLLAFLPRYGLSALAHNFLLLNVSTQWALLLQGVRHGRLRLGLHNVLAAEFAAVTVLISVGAVLGRTSPCQLLAVAFCEVPVYLASEWLVVTQLGVRDVGGTITIHVFACYFGLGVSKALFGTERRPAHPKETPTPRSDLLALASWLRPCQPGDAQHRAILNTFLALSAGAVTTVVASSLLESGGKLSLGHLQNGSLAGGVAIGALADVPITPAASLALGSLSSARLPCGIHNLHGFAGHPRRGGERRGRPGGLQGHQEVPVVPRRWQRGGGGSVGLWWWQAGAVASGRAGCGPWRLAAQRDAHRCRAAPALPGPAARAAVLRGFAEFQDPGAG
uniref:Ammonium transporter AmtB-like domain-containing protein n=1 Tax=Anas platyrhynchos TaxID=8839 RepID=A0A8B9T9A2_ANAPL